MAMALRMRLCVEKRVAVYRVDLHLVPASLDEELHEVGDFPHSIRHCKRGVVYLYSERPAVAHRAKVWLGEGPDHAHRAFHRHVQGRRIVGGKRLAFKPSVRRSRHVPRVPDVVHGASGAGAEDSAAVVPLAVEGVSPERDELLREIVRPRIGVAHLRRCLCRGENVGASGEIGVEQLHELFERDEPLLEDELPDGRERIHGDGNASSVDSEVVVLRAFRDVPRLLYAIRRDDRHKRPRKDLDMRVFLHKCIRPALNLGEELALHVVKKKLCASASLR